MGAGQSPNNEAGEIIMKPGQYIRSKELGTIYLIDLDVYKEKGLNNNIGNVFQIRQISKETVHGGFAGDTAWKTKNELIKKYEIVPYKEITNIDYKFKVIEDTDKTPNQLIDDYVYLKAKEEAEIIDAYLLLHIKQRPWYIPEFIYKFILKKILVMNRFTKNEKHQISNHL